MEVEGLPSCKAGFKKTDLIILCKQVSSSSGCLPPLAVRVATGLLLGVSEIAHGAEMGHT